MAKLLRMHLVGVGHEEARFHPLSVRLGQTGVPMNSVINLRNGGGKTSLLSLIYTVLLPGKHDFLGKVNGSNRTLDDNFILGKLGIVALEMESQVGRFCLMLAWVRREREDPPTLFSFRTGREGIPFEELPLQGLCLSPARTLADLNRWLTDRHSKTPGNVDLFVASNYRDWHNHLKAQRGVDAHLYRKGCFEEADGGTLFLDELGEMPTQCQAKLLRAIQNGKIQRLGDSKEFTVNVRVIAATNVDVKHAIEEKAFRKDLYYRFEAKISIPSLRDRRNDIPKLAHHFLERWNQKHQKQRRLSQQSIIALMKHPWPGNVRELEGVVIRSAQLCSSVVARGICLRGDTRSDRNYGSAQR